MRPNLGGGQQVRQVDATHAQPGGGRGGRVAERVAELDVLRCEDHDGPPQHVREAEDVRGVERAAVRLGALE